MARSSHGKHLSKCQQRDATERKRDERAVRNAHRKKRKEESYLADDENFASFSNQLQLMDLKLRDIPGDGNCLFRALGDQFDGHGRNHLFHREQAVQYIKQHQDFFEPFMEDNISFDDHLSNLNNPGTYAGNDSIAAFAKRHSVDVVIHQLNLPVWKVSGTDGSSAAREIHISFHNGDHYSSIRSSADVSNNPTNFKSVPITRLAAEYSNKTKKHERTKKAEIKNLKSDHNHSPDISTSRVDIISELQLAVMEQSNCQNLEQVQEALEENEYDVDAAITYLLQMAELYERLEPVNSVGDDKHGSEEAGGLWSVDGTGNRLFGSAPANATDTHSQLNRTTKGAEGSLGNKDAQVQPKLNTRQKKQQQKRDRKQRQTERHRQKILGENSPNSLDASDEGATVVLAGEMGALSI